MTPMRTSFCRVFLHIGSIALGSLIIAVATIINLVIAYIAAKMEESPTHENPVIACCLKCCLCISDCFKRFL